MALKMNVSFGLFEKALSTDFMPHCTDYFFASSIKKR